MGMRRQIECDIYKLFVYTYLYKSREVIRNENFG